MGKPPEPAQRRADPRHAIDVPARLVVEEEGRPEQVRLIDLSRNGFRVASARRLAAGSAVRLEVDGWPRLAGQVVWCDGGRIGCVVAVPPSEAVYAMMRESTQGRRADDDGAPPRR